MKILSIRNYESISLFTCYEDIFDSKTKPFQFLITTELDPHEAPCGSDHARTAGSTEAVDERRETEGTIPYLNVVEAALERRLNVIGLIKGQLNSLAG